MNVDNVIIVGAGPGGLATALQLKRYGLPARIFEKDTVGGLLKNANLVENYPGFPGGIPGVALVQLMEKQAHEIGVRVSFAEVTSAEYEDGEFTLQAGGDRYRSKVLVLASGTTPKRLPGLQIPPEIRDKVFYDVYPLMQVIDRRIAIIGAGDAAFDYALNLSRHNDVLILNRGEGLRCLGLLWERAAANPRIRYQEHTTVTEVLPGTDGDLIVKCDTLTGRVEYTIHYLVGAIGRDPQLGYLSDCIRRDSKKLEGDGRLYYVGDVYNGIYRQTAIAVGEGIMTAMKIYRRYEELEG